MNDDLGCPAAVCHTSWVSAEEDRIAEEEAEAEEAAAEAQAAEEAAAAEAAAAAKAEEERLAEEARNKPIVLTGSGDSVVNLVKNGTGPYLVHIVGNPAR